MRNIKLPIWILAFSAMILFSCNDLDLNPLSEGSSESWYSNEDEINMACAYLYKIDFWDQELVRLNGSSDGYSMEWSDKFTDDWTARETLSVITNGTINSQTNFVEITWANAYKCIAAANRIIMNLSNAKDKLSEEKLKYYEAIARFARASQYARLIFLYGDVPYYENILDIEESLNLERTDKNIILKSIYADYDFAAQYLPLTYTNTNQYPTKGAAYGMKARASLYMHDYESAKKAAKACMDLNTYKLFDNYQNLFLSKTKNSVESVFNIPRSVALGVIIPGSGRAKEPITRIAGGFGNGGPSWDLFAAYLCKDGLPIDESSLYNPRKPFDNRDPRLTASIVPFGTPWLGFTYQPHPDSLTVMNFNTGLRQRNVDSRGVDQYASYNALTWKKKVDEDWLDLLTDPDNTILRYADVLLIYAEAAIELNTIDQSVLDAINQVRARAYKVSYQAVGDYPAVTSMDANTLRKTVRIERRMEFAFEGLRYADLIRWKLAEKALNTPIYGLLNTADLRKNVIQQNLWFFASVTPIDEDGIADYSAMFNNGKILKLVERRFDKSKQYLWPIPAKEILTNPKLKQNNGY